MHIMSNESLRRHAKWLILNLPPLRGAYEGVTERLHQQDVPHARGRRESLLLEDSGMPQANRQVLKAFGPWLSEDALRGSRFNYGIEELHRRHLDEAVDDPAEPGEVNVSDLLCILASRTADLSYLEIGVSVGRNLWQVMHATSHARITCMDINPLYPLLGARLRREAAPGERQGMGTAAHIDLYAFDARAHVVEYVTGDVLGTDSWDALAGRQFNLVFSDALHEPDAILHEWRQLADRRLLSPAGFTMVWDDLNSRGMRQAFNRIAADAINRFGAAGDGCWLLHLPGWLGHREQRHPIGIVQSRGYGPGPAGDAGRPAR
jgi:hypothetical protein